MKAKVITNSDSWTLELEAEDENEQIALKVMGRLTSKKVYKFACRGIQYMDPVVQFDVFPPDQTPVDPY